MLQKLLRHALFPVLAFLVLEQAICALLVLMVPKIVLSLGRHTPPFVRDLRFELNLAIGVFAAAALTRKIAFWPRLANALVDARKTWQAVLGFAGTLIVFFTIKVVVDHTGGHLYVPDNHRFPLAFALLLALCAAVVEEIAYRGYILPYLEQQYGTLAAVGGSALIFGGVHLLNGYPYTVISCLLIAGTGGLLFSAAFILTRRLYLSIGLHWGYDVASFFLLGNTHFRPLYASHSTQLILMLLGILEMYIGIFFLYFAYRQGKLKLSKKHEGILQSFFSSKPLSLSLLRFPQRK